MTFDKSIKSLSKFLVSQKFFRIIIVPLCFASMLYPAMCGVAIKHLEISSLFGDGSPIKTSDK